jgi:hypothetical protein
MAKIPLEKTIGGAYNFLFSNILSVIGIVWLPYLLFGSLAGGSVWLWLKAHPLAMFHFDKPHFDPAALVAIAQIAPVLFVCAMLAELIATVGLVRKALGRMEGTTFVFFTLGAPVWRLLGAHLLVMVINIGTVIGLAIAAVLWGLFGQKFVPNGIGILIDVVGVIAMVLWVIYMVVRLVFFIPAVVVAEEKVGVGRSWELGGGNFWRILIVFLLIALPAGIAFGILNSVVTTSLYGPLLVPDFAGNPHPDPQLFFNFYQQAIARSLLPAALALNVLYAIVLRALYAGAVATAYRAVTATETAPAA